MANYLKVTNFAVKDGLTTSDPNKIVKGSEINFEFDAIQTSINGKADLESPVFTGAPKAPTAPLGTETTQLASTLFVKNAIDAIPAGTTVGTLGTQDKDAVDITGGTVSGLTQLAIDASAQAATQTSLDVPSRTGAGASGTWNINISGSAGSISTANVNAAIAGSEAGQVGTYAFLRQTSQQSQLPGGEHDVASGYSLEWAGIYEAYNGALAIFGYAGDGSITPIPAGTWKAMGYGRAASNALSNSATLWLRVV